MVGQQLFDIVVEPEEVSFGFNVLLVNVKEVI
jgi:hypothetical protein